MKNVNRVAWREGEHSSDGVPRFISNVPQQILADWDSTFGPRLAGFPLNLVYASVRNTESGNSLVSCCYWFDPSSYVEDMDKREMAYFPRVKSSYRVKVEYHKSGHFWRTLKYKGEQLVCEAQGPEFARAMIQATLVGVQPDEPVD